MAGVSSLISSLLSSVAKLLPKVKISFFTPSSSSSSQSPNANAVEDDLNELIKTLNRIKATLYDAEKREIQDLSVKLWLKELKEVGHEAEYVIDEYMYEVYRAKVEAAHASDLNPHKRKQDKGSSGASGPHSVRVPDGLVGHIRQIRSKFDKIVHDREALRLREEDGPRRNRCHAQYSSTSILESNVFGREKDKKRMIDLLLSIINDRIITVIPVVGKGGLGKTTLAKLVYDDRRVKQHFDIFGWTCVSENFCVKRLMQDLIESFTRNSCSIKNLSTLQEKLKEIVMGKKVFVVLDDVWNDNKFLWDIFCLPFMSVVRVAFIVTTQSNRVAKIMQTTYPFQLNCLSEGESWSLFQHYAFGGTDHNVDTNLLDLGRKITMKCGGLPLAVKSISNLLCYENEESWVEILQNDLWQINAETEIFGALQISYTHMPAYLKPCFLYCSLFPKDYVYETDRLIELWIAAGYIESKGNKTLEEIAYNYVQELRERSFFDPIYRFPGLELQKKFKMHDMVHDLARRNSANEIYSIERCEQCDPPDEVLHFYLENYHESENQLNLNNVAKLRTLVLKFKSGSNYIDLSEAKRLRTLKLQDDTSSENALLPHFVFPKHLRFLELSCAIGAPLDISLSSLYHLERLNLNLNNSIIELEALQNLINLQYLSLSNCTIERFPESLGLICNLRTLCIIGCTQSVFPETIGNLIQLQNLVIHDCKQLCYLPESLCNLSDLTTLRLTECWKITKLPNDIGNLTNLHSLMIWSTGINYLPSSFNKLKVFPQSKVIISMRLDGVPDTIRWFTDFHNFKGALSISNVGHIFSLEDARNCNLISKPFMEKLLISWGKVDLLLAANKLAVKIKNKDESMKKKKIARKLLDKDMDLWILESLQPHPNLKYLEIREYPNPVFPGWMGDQLSCASLKELHITSCTNITYLPSFGNLGSLTHLKIKYCYKLNTISRDSLPSQLQSLTIGSCFSLCSLTALKDLKWLVELDISSCRMLKSFPFELISEEHYRKSSSSRSKNLNPLKILKIVECENLHLGPNEVLPSTHCNIKIAYCNRLKDWCLQHNISYTARKCSSCGFQNCSCVAKAYSRQWTGKQMSQCNKVGASSSQGKHIPQVDEDTEKVSSSANVIDEETEKVSSSANVIDEEMAKGNSSTDVLDED
ncbi:hypothetical protein LUZ60_002434 [Juncus effusus]|nr:hypothetical protein LUZ60_002434 [Juncus effusus]